MFKIFWEWAKSYLNLTISSSDYWTGSPIMTYFCLSDESWISSNLKTINTDLNFNFRKVDKVGLRWVWQIHCRKKMIEISQIWIRYGFWFLEIFDTLCWSLTCVFKLLYKAWKLRFYQRFRFNRMLSKPNPNPRAVIDDAVRTRQA